MDSLEKVGINNVTFETDYPHTDSTWPNTLQVAEEMMGHLPEHTLWKIVRGNAAQMLDIELDDEPASVG